jgi:DNA-directed RNA polymerase subunit M/transcription elongation factor TFIIS
MNDNVMVDVECIKDPCLARRTCRPCIKCRGTQAVTFINPTKDRMNLIFVCTNCAHHWRKDELDENDVPLDDDSDD